MSWKKLLESVSESLNDHIRLRNEYLLAENRILRNQIDGRVQLTDSERKELAELGAKLGKKALAEIATVAQPDTILAWNRTCTDQQVDASAPPKSVGRPRVDKEIEELVVRMACENRSWGYDRIQGALNHLSYTISDQTVGNILKRHGIAPAPERKKTVSWREFIGSHWDVLVTTGFFDSEVWGWFGLMVSYLLRIFHFGLHPIQSVRQTRYQLMLTMRALVCRVLTWMDTRPRWTPLLAQRFRSRRSAERALAGEVGSELACVAVRPTRSQELAKVVNLSSARRRPIRDGPSCCRPSLVDSLLVDHDCEAA